MPPAPPLPQAIAAPTYSAPLSGEFSGGKGDAELPVATKDQNASAPAVNSWRAMSALLAVPFQVIAKLAAPADDVTPYQILHDPPVSAVVEGRSRRRPQGDISPSDRSHVVGPVVIDDGDD